MLCYIYLMLDIVGVTCESDMYGRTTRYPTSMTVPRTATMYPSRTTTDYPPCPCYNGGTCIYGIFCHCPDGYTGIHCQISKLLTCSSEIIISYSIILQMRKSMVYLCT